MMETETSRLKEGSEDEYEAIKEIKTLNSMVPIWRKNKSELSDEDYNKFYTEKFHDFEPPLKYIHVKAEGTATYNALLFIPARTPFDFYTKEYEKGLQLYSSGVMIMEKCGDLLPDYFGFVKGLVDSEDLSLNISREMLQHDRQLKIIEKNLEKSIKNNLLKMLGEDREKYESFFKNFGLQLKFGVYNGYGANKELLQDLLMFRSSFSDKLTTLDEYASRMKEEQKYIYYATGENAAKIELLPQTEMVREKGFEILYFTDDVDEFAIKMLMQYKDKQFMSVSSENLELESDEEKKEAEKQLEENKAMLTLMKEALSGKVTDVRLSKRLKSHPVCLSNGGEISIEMEKVLNTMPNGGGVKADKVLEINASHPIFEKLRGLYDTDKDKLGAYSKILYTQALLIEGLSIENPVEYTNMICDIMTD
jgi:molecular chaperone HtpG